MVVSAGLGALFWARSRDPRTFFLSLAFGVLVDLDHFVDYWYSEGRLTFDFREFMRTRYWRKSGRIFILFHAFEWLPIVYLVWQSLKGKHWALAATAALSSHVLADHLVNDLKPLGYFISYRISHGFEAARIMDRGKADRREAQRAERKRLARAGQLSTRERIVNLFV